MSVRVGWRRCWQRAPDREPSGLLSQGLRPTGPAPSRPHRALLLFSASQLHGWFSRAIRPEVLTCRESIRPQQFGKTKVLLFLLPSGVERWEGSNGSFTKEFLDQQREKLPIYNDF